MRPKIILLALLIISGIIAASCSQHVCPAYSQQKETETEKKA
jgi:hypothetical protein